MYRKRIKNKNYLINDLMIKSVSLFDDLDVGNWEVYPWIKLIYLNKEKDYDGDLYILKKNKEIIGYFLYKEEINVNNDFLKEYDRKMVLIDFAIDDRRYAYYGKIAVNYLLKIAKEKGMCALEIKKSENYIFFIEFIKRHFRVLEDLDNYYILVNKPKFIPYHNNLFVSEDDNLSISSFCCFISCFICISSCSASSSLNIIGKF